LLSLAHRRSTQTADVAPEALLYEHVSTLSKQISSASDNAQLGKKDASVDDGSSSGIGRWFPTNPVKIDSNHTEHQL